MKVLVTAYSCEPDKGSEPGVGWHWVRQIARRFECHLITRENNVEAVVKAARAEGLDQLTVHGHDLPRWARFWKRGSRGSSLYYYLWQLSLIPLARRIDRKFSCDVVHHVTYVSSCWPSGLAFLRKPFVWGPVGQHPRIPSAFIRKSDLRLRFIEAGKSALKWTLQNLDPLFRKTLQSSDLILSLSKPFDEQLGESHAGKLIPFPAVGVEPMEQEQAPLENEKDFEVLFSGRLVDLKGVRLALEAFAIFAKDQPDARFRLLGEGPLREELIARATELGVADQVVFEGHLPHEQALEAMRTADVFLFPSFEGAGMVVLEAMAANTPVLCLDFGGPGRMVGEDRGLRVPVLPSFEQTAASLANSLKLLHTDGDLRKRLLVAARDWIRNEMTWDVKGDRLERFYSLAIEHRKDRAA